MSISQFLSILRARWRIALTALVITVATTLVVSLLLPKNYSASASVVLDVKADPISAVINPMVATPAFMATQVDIIQSDRVAQRVVRNLKLASIPKVRQQFLEETANSESPGTIESWLADQFQKQLEVKPSRESNVIAIGFSGAQPDFVAAIANGFVQAYIDTSIELRTDPAKQYSTFFDQRAKDARDNLEKAQSRLSAFQREKGIIATDERLDIENSRLAELSSQLVAIQAITVESNSRQAQATAGAGDRLYEVINNPVVAGLKADLGRQEARLQEMNSKLGEANPQVVELKANIHELRARLEAETRRLSSSVGVTGNINRQREGQGKRKSAPIAGAGFDRDAPAKLFHVLADHIHPDTATGNIGNRFCG